MPQFQHRSGPPSRPRNSDHTRWELEPHALDWSHWLLILTLFAVGVIIACSVTIWAPVPFGGAK